MGGDLITSHVVEDPCNKHTGNGTHVVGDYYTLYNIIIILLLYNGG